LVVKNQKIGCQENLLARKSQNKSKKHERNGSSPSSSSSSSSDEINEKKSLTPMIQPDDYDLIRSDPEENHFDGNEILEILKINNDGMEFERKLKEKGSKFTNLVVGKREMNADQFIFEIFAKDDCCPPQGLICPYCHYAIFGIEENILFKIMVRYARKKHSMRNSAELLPEFYNVNIAFDVNEYLTEVG
jgi:hypothetical protein